MKAQALKLEAGRYVETEVDATHVRLNIPGPQGLVTLPIRGKVQAGPTWIWNGDTERPTLIPSILTTVGKPNCSNDPDETYFVCHSFVTDGQVQFLSDCTHEFAGQLKPLLEVKADA